MPRKRCLRGGRCSCRPEPAELAVIIHDLNNALNAIVGFADLALLGPQDSETQRELEQIRASGLRAADLVRRIVDRTDGADLAPGAPPGGPLRGQSPRRPSP